MGHAHVIDIHTHIFPPEIAENREQFMERDHHFATLYADPRARIATAEDLVAELDLNGMAAAVACGFGWSDHALCVAHNDYLIDAVRRFGGRIVGFAAIQPRLGERAASEMQRVIGAGLGGVGELMPHAQGYRLDDERAMAPVAEAALALDVPILTHTSEPVGHLYPGKGDVTVDSLYKLAVRYPDLRIIGGHWGGGLPFYELMPEVKVALANVYYDSAASPYLYHSSIYAVASALCGSHKVLFGSDFPLLRQKRCLNEVHDLGLSIEMTSAILGNNAARLLGVPSAE